jgi:hypothetical protein
MTDQMATLLQTELDTTTCFSSVASAGWQLSRQDGSCPVPFIFLSLIPLLTVDLLFQYFWLYACSIAMRRQLHAA